MPGLTCDGLKLQNSSSHLHGEVYNYPFHTPSPRLTCVLFYERTWILIAFLQVMHRSSSDKDGKTGFLPDSGDTLAFYTVEL